ILCFGDEGVDTVAALVGVPAKTWVNVEAGVNQSAIVILRLIDATGANPSWLLTGEGPMFMPARGPFAAAVHAGWCDFWCPPCPGDAKAPVPGRRPASTPAPAAARTRAAPWPRAPISYICQSWV